MSRKMKFYISFERHFISVS